MRPVTTTDKPSVAPEFEPPPGSARHATTHLQGEPVAQVASQTQDAPMLKRLVWFAFIWLCSVGALALVAGLIRWVIKP